MRKSKQKSSETFKSGLTERQKEIQDQFDRWWSNIVAPTGIREKRISVTGRMRYETVVRKAKEESK